VEPQRQAQTVEALWLLQLGLGQLGNTSCKLGLQEGNMEKQREVAEA
jgi:hypothetical protein